MDSTLSKDAELAPAEKMQMQMVNRLATPLTGVGNDTIAIRDQTLLRRDHPRRQQQASGDERVVVAQVTHRRDVLARDDQYMGRRCRLNIAERDDRVIVIDAFSRDLAPNDPAEDTLLIAAYHLTLPSSFADSGSGSIMPELPEVETVRRTLDPLLRGRRISNFILGWHRTLEHPSLERFNQEVVGSSITEVTRRGKLILIWLSTGGAITVHLRMTGELLFRPDASIHRNSVRDAYLRASFSFREGSELIFYDTRKFGKIAYRSTDDLVELDGRLGAEPLEPGFTADRLAAILLARRRQVKPLLLDQSVIAGLGNIYVDESLFRSRIHPLQVSSDIDENRMIALHAAIVDVLSTAIALHGTTLRDYRTGLGEQGENQSRLRVYGLKPGTPCPDCGSPLERLVVGQRGSIFCPNCQPWPGLSDTPRQ